LFERGISMTIIFFHVRIKLAVAPVSQERSLGTFTAKIMKYFYWRDHIGHKAQADPSDKSLPIVDKFIAYLVSEMTGIFLLVSHKRDKTTSDGTD
jgi:hypothetical protein